MRYIIRFIDWFLYTSLLTACCATGLCMATERLINTSLLTLLSNLHLLIFGSTLLVYNAPRLLRAAFASENNALGIFRNYRFWYLFFFILGALITISSLSQLSRQMLIACGILSVFAFGYTLPLLPLKNKKRLRDFGSMKILVLAGVWTIATSVLPILYHDKIISNYPFEILLRFVFIFILCVIFDIRDMQADLKNDLYTLPNKMGIKNSNRLINMGLFLFAGLSILQCTRYFSPERIAGAIITAILTRITASYLQRNPSDRAYMGLADGLMIVYSLLVLIPFSN